MCHPSIRVLPLIVLLAGAVAAQVTFGPATGFAIPAPGGLTTFGARVVTGDVDADGDEDVLVLNPGTNPILSNVLIYLNDGSGNLAAPSLWNVGAATSTGAGANQILLLDLDSDGLPELIVTRGGNLEVYFNQGNAAFGTPQAPAATYNLALPIVEDLKAADVDGNGLRDVVVLGAGFGSGVIQALLNDGSGTVTTVAQTAITGQHESIALGDLDGDGDVDAVTTNAAAFEVSVHVNTGSGVFALPSTISTGVGQPMDVGLGDLDADGDLDMVYAHSFGMTTYLNTGSGSFTFHPHALGALSNVAWLTTADFDLDGLAEAAFARVDTFQLYACESVGGLTNLQPLGSVGGTLTTGDLDGDGYADLVSLGFTLLDVRLNTSSGTGLATSVDGGVFNGHPKTFGAGSSLSIGTNVTADPTLAGKSAVILVNLEPESTQSAVTTLVGGGAFPGLTIVHPLSVPSGTAYVMGDSIGLASSPYPGLVDLGFGPLVMGQAPYVLTMPALPSGYRIRAQAIYFDPIPANFATLGLVATNRVELTAL